MWIRSLNLSDGEFCLAARMRFGLNPLNVQSDPKACCNFCKGLINSVAHLGTCKKLHNQRHLEVRKALERFLVRARFSPTVEPQYPVHQRRRVVQRPDILAFSVDRPGGFEPTTAFLIDVSLLEPCAASYLEQPLTVPQLLERRVSAKLDDYKELRDQRAEFYRGFGSRTKVETLPFVLTTSGWLPQNSGSFLQKRTARSPS